MDSRKPFDGTGNTNRGGSRSSRETSRNTTRSSIAGSDPRLPWLLDGTPQLVTGVTIGRLVFLGPDLSATSSQRLGARPSGGRGRRGPDTGPRTRCGRGLGTGPRVARRDRGG